MNGKAWMGVALAIILSASPAWAEGREVADGAAVSFSSRATAITEFELYAALFSLPAVADPTVYGALLAGGGAWLALADRPGDSRDPRWLGPAWLMGLAAVNLALLDDDMSDAKLFGANLLSWNVGALAYTAYSAAVTPKRSKAGDNGASGISWQVRPQMLVASVRF